MVLRVHINCRQMEEIASRTRTLIAPRRRPKTRSQAQREPRSVSLPSNGQGRDERPLDNAEQPTSGDDNFTDDNLGTIAVSSNVRAPPRRKNINEEQRTQRESSRESSRASKQHRRKYRHREDDGSDWSTSTRSSVRGSRGRNCTGEGEFRGFSRSRREHVDHGNMMNFYKQWGLMGYRNPRDWLTLIDRDALKQNTVRSIKCQENETIKWGSKIVKRPKCSLTLLSLKMMWRYILIYSSPLKTGRVGTKFTENRAR